MQRLREVCAIADEDGTLAIRPTKEGIWVLKFEEFASDPKSGYLVGYRELDTYETSRPEHNPLMEALEKL